MPGSSDGQAAHAKRVSERFPIVLAIGISIAHWLTYTVLWGFAFALGEGGRSLSSEILGAAAYVLGTPLMHLLVLGPQALMVNGSRWWGDDSILILGLSAANALVWGVAIAWLVRRRRVRIQRGRPNNS